MVKQARIEVIKYFVFLVIFLIFGVTIHKIVIRFAQEQEDDSGEVSLVVKVIFSIIAFFYVIIQGESVLTALLNPEYWALQQVLEFIK